MTFYSEESKAHRAAQVEYGVYNIYLYKACEGYGYIVCMPNEAEFVPSQADLIWQYENYIPYDKRPKAV